MMKCQTFDPDRDIPDLSGKVVLVTGANSGIGRETVLQLTKHNPSRIFVGARSQSKAEEAIEQIKQALPDTASSVSLTFLKLDLSSFQSIKTAVETFRASSNRLDILINNAGIMATPPGQTEEGYEIQFGTNHMGHALLTRLLLPVLKQTAAAETNADVRVIFLSSALESTAPKTGYESNSTLRTNMQDFSTWTRYGQSKLANIHYARALSQQYPEIKFISLHPGVVETNLTTEFISGLNWLVSVVLRFVKGFITVGVEKGALTSLWAATSPDAKSGVFYHPVGVAGKDTRLARDEGVCRRLWEYTEKELQPHVS